MTSKMLFLAAAALAIAAAAAPAQCEVQKLTGSLDNDYDRFGEDLAIDGDVMIMGGWGGGFGGGDLGRVYIYRQVGTTWIEEAVLTRSGGARGELFGVAVDIEGDTAVVGAPWEHAVDGAAYVFERVAGVWTQVARLANPNDYINQQELFGSSVAIEGTTVVVGTSSDDNFAGDGGAAYVFEKPAGGWADTNLAVAELVSSDITAGDFFGWDVAFENGVIVVGATEADGAGFYAGAVYVFVEPSGGWTDMTETAKLTCAETDGNLGWSVAIDGDRILAGAPNALADKGAVFMYEKPAGGWADMTAETRRFDTSDVGARLGTDVAIEGDWILLGAPISVVYGNVGVVDSYRFDSVTSTWTFQWKIEGSDSNTPPSNSDEFGNSVAIEGPLFFVGAPGDDEHIPSFADFGAAYVGALDSPSASFVEYGKGTLQLSGSVADSCESDIVLTTTGAPPNTSYGFCILAFVPVPNGINAGPIILYVAPPWLIFGTGGYDATGTMTITGTLPYYTSIGLQAWFQTFAIAKPNKLYSNGLELTVIE